MREFAPSPGPFASTGTQRDLLPTDDEIIAESLEPVRSMVTRHRSSLTSRLLGDLDSALRLMQECGDAALAFVARPPPSVGFPALAEPPRQAFTFYARTR